MKYLPKIAAIAFVLLFMAIGTAFAGDVTQGELQVINKEGRVVNLCPLKHTDVKADISGFVSRVTVTQVFSNPFKDHIEAVYVFPLPQNSAVDSMTMKIGKRTIKGVIKEKEEARKIYEDAKKQGKTAALLDQNRPNIFTQSVANIGPGEEVIIDISYVETLAYNDGIYEFVFPMVVGPRYMPGAPSGKQGTGWSPDTTQVPDASKISPPVAPKGTRAGHDITVSVNIDAGVPIKAIRSVLHKVNVKHAGSSKNAVITLSQQDNIPNKDFILQFETAGKTIEDAILSHAKDGEGFFTLILQPPDKPKQAEITPKEMYFVLDASGSQMGWPVEKAKETMKYCIENMNNNDTFQILSFDNNVTPCFKSPVPNTKENREAAQQWLATQAGRGGTQMMKAIDYSLGAPADPERMRIVVFMTDGYVGNDMAILDAIQKKLGNARLFPFGTGNSVNRYLLEGMAKMGKGEVEWVTLNRHGDEVAEAFQDKIGNPLLLDIKVDWGNAPVKDIYPQQIPDLFSGKPVILKGRCEGSFDGTITLKGMQAGKPFSRKIRVDFPKNRAENDVLGVLWARAKIEDLMNRDLKGIQQGKPDKEIKQMITNLGLKFKLMTQFTSFVAVEEKVVNKDGKLVTVPVPVEMPDGVSHEGVFGKDRTERESRAVFGGGKTYSRMPAKSSIKKQPGPSAPPPPVNQTPISPAPEEDDNIPVRPDSKPTSKISDSLKGIEKKVENEGSNGNLKLDTFEVKNGKIELILSVSHISRKILMKLKEMGFVVKTQSKTNKVITGVIAVEKIEELAKLSFVLKIDPNPSK